MLNSYLQTLASLARDAKYMTLLSPDYLGGFLSPENQTEKHSNTVSYECRLIVDKEKVCQSCGEVTQSQREKRTLICFLDFKRRVSDNILL